MHNFYLIFRNNLHGSISDYQKITTENQSSIPWIFLLVNSIFFIILSALAFHQNIAYLFYAIDGPYMMILAKENLLWRGFEFGLSSNFFQSIGGPWFPLNTMFIPGYAIAALLSENIVLSKISAYVVFSFEFFIIGLIVSRTIGLVWNYAIIVAWLLPLIAYPYHYYPVPYYITTLVPHFGTIVVTTNLIIILFISLGRQGLVKSTVAAFFIAMLTLFIAISAPAAIMICAPIVAIIWITDIVSCTSIKEKKFKLIFTITMLIFLMLSGVLPYFYGLIKFTMAYYFPGDLLNAKSAMSSWSNVSILFNKKGSCLFLCGVLGITFKAVYGDSYNKILARGLLISIAAIIVFGIFVVNFEIWDGPIPIYFEVALWPFYVAYGITFIQLSFIIIKRLLFYQLRINRYRYTRLLLLILPWTILLLPKPIPDAWNLPNPPVKSPIVEHLNREISLMPGSKFRGRVANLTGRRVEGPVTLFGQSGLDYLILKKTGNEHRMNGLWYYNIPTLDVFNPLISPTYYQFIKAFFALPQDQQIRNVVVIRKPDVRWLTSLGVRYVITDAPIAEGIERKLISLIDLGNLYLYELISPNIGQYSPTEAMKVVNDNVALKMLMEKKFDPTNQIITDFKLPHKLIKSKDGKMFVNKGFIDITASSQGNSIILLPLEFSHCLSIISHAPKGEVPKLFRANLIQTGVLFHESLNASIRYYTGPFYNSTCRLTDAKNFEKNALYIK